MDKAEMKQPDNELDCPVCGGRGKALLGPGNERRLSPPRMKCRKCEQDYWENQQTGMLQEQIDPDE